MDVLLTGVPDAGVEAAEEEAIVPGLPAVVHLALVRLVHAVVDAVVAPLLAAVGLGDALGALAPVRGDEGGGGEEQGHQVKTHRQQRATFPRGLHDLSASGRVPTGGKKVHPRRRRQGAVRGGGGGGEEEEEKMGRKEEEQEHREEGEERGKRGGWEEMEEEASSGQGEVEMRRKRRRGEGRAGEEDKERRNRTQKRG